MSKLNTKPLIQDEVIEIEESSSSWILFTTMLLLIAGLLLSSIMMLHYASTKIGNGDETTGHTFNLAGLMEKAKAYTEHLQKTTEAQPVQPNPAAQLEESGLINLFSGRTDHVRWPKLKLTGFGSSSEGGDGFAIINGSQLNLGQLIDGKAKLVQIRAHDVVVEYMGESKMLTVDIQN